MKIIVHIGAGKTGTSSIQFTLKQNAEELNAQGFRYLGLILENASKLKYDWQKYPAGNFNRVNKEQLFHEVLDVLNTTIQEANKEGIHTLIWSNESFFGLHDKIMPILSELDKEHEIKIISYVRKHEAWIRSAYVQWGIKHKVYQGKIREFKQWYKPGKALFYLSLKPYVDIFGNRVVVKNMIGHNDLVKSFLEECNIETSKIIIKKSNESPSNEELILRSLYNNNFKGEVLPVLFDRTILKLINKNMDTENVDPSMYLQRLLPSEEDIKKVNDEVTDDRTLINQLLRASGEQEIESEIGTQKNVQVDNGKLLMLLAKLVVQQSINIQRLQKDLEKLKNDP